MMPLSTGSKLRNLFGRPSKPQLGEGLWVDANTHEVYRKRPHVIAFEFDGKTDDGRVRLVHEVPNGVDYQLTPNHVLDLTVKAEVFDVMGSPMVCGACGKVTLSVWDLFEREMRGRVAAGYLNYGLKAPVVEAVRAVNGDRLILEIECPPEFVGRELTVRAGLTCDGLVRLAL